jgi:hypothetical protein
MSDTELIDAYLSRQDESVGAVSAMPLAGLLTAEASAAVPEALSPMILATVKSVAATGVATTAAATKAAMLAKGAMRGCSGTV